MRGILSKLDGEGDPLPKNLGSKGMRNRKKELEGILNTTHSIKTFANIDEEKQKFQEENILRIKEATYQIDISSQEFDDVEMAENQEIAVDGEEKTMLDSNGKKIRPELQFISMCKYSKLVQNDIQTVISKMGSSLTNTNEAITDDKGVDGLS